MRATIYTEYTDEAGDTDLTHVRHYRSTEGVIATLLLNRKVTALRKRMGARERIEYSNLPGGSLLVTYLHTKGGVVVHYW